MKMRMSVYDRMKLNDFIPQKAGLEKAIIAVDIRKKVELTQEEIQQFKIKTIDAGGGQLKTTWDESIAIEAEFDLTKLEVELLKDGFQALQKADNIETNDKFVSLCMKIKHLNWEESEK